MKITAFLFTFMILAFWACNNSKQEKPKTAPPAGIDQKYLSVLNDTTSLNAGKEIFMKNCSVCHAKDGGGVVGPNFTDNYWIYGNTFNDLFPIVINGVYEKGMISYKNKFSHLQIQQALSYIFTLQGTTPANPKAPDGNPY